MRLVNKIGARSAIVWKKSSCNTRNAICCTIVRFTKKANWRLKPFYFRKANHEKHLLHFEIQKVFLLKLKIILFVWFNFVAHLPNSLENLYAQPEWFIKKKIDFSSNKINTKVRVVGWLAFFSSKKLKSIIHACSHIISISIWTCAGGCCMEMLIFWH